MKPETESKSLIDRLQQVRAKRGYLLPHHGLLAVSSPALLAAYDETYSQMTLERRVLSAHDHEMVWLAILVAARESLATHHIAKFIDAGGTQKSFQSLLGLVAWLEGVGCYRFVAQHWQRHLPGTNLQQCYSADFETASAGLPARTASLAAVAVHACQGHWDALAWQIELAYQRSVPETEIAEALTLMMFPGSVPGFSRAAGVWRQLILDERVEASVEFRAWAEISGQGGYDEAIAATAADDN